MTEDVHCSVPPRQASLPPDVSIPSRHWEEMSEKPDGKHQGQGKWPYSKSTREC